MIQQALMVVGKKQLRVLLYESELKKIMKDKDGTICLNIN